jgi:F0F1-type ATP synthase assembly protein I
MTDDPEHGSMPEDEDIEARLDAFHTKVKDAGAKRMPEVPEWSYTRPPKQKELGGGGDPRSLGIGITAAYMLLGGMVGGSGIGWIIDHAAHSAPLWSASLGLLGACLGIVAVLIMINRGNK